MAVEEIQAVTARIAALDQRLQQLGGGGSAPGLPLGLALRSTGTNLAVKDFNQVLDRSMATSRPLLTSANSPTIDTALRYATRQIGDPYVFGSDGPDTWDCSSLTQASFQSAGVSLPRTASEQAQAGTAVPVDRNAIRPGDLVFMRGGKPAHDLGHVGIAISADEFIAAPHSGESVQVQAIPWSRVQRIRRVA
jgi:cell wall-associated NlpC family hydrolase